MATTLDAPDEHYGAEKNDRNASIVTNHVPVADTNKSKWERLWPVIACGAGLFSDGYLNGIIGPVNTMLQEIYPKQYANSPAQANVTAITFVGTVVGMLFFGYTSDKYSRKWSLFVSTIIVILFAILATGSYGAGGSISGMFSALVAYRFLLGIGIGGEYPAGSVGCAESTGELKEGSRNKWFILFTNVQIDLGFVVSALVSLIVVVATGENHLRAAWRICLGLGVLPPLSLLYLRYKLNEPEAYARESMAKTRTPWLLVLRFYGIRLATCSIIWFIYDFSSYSFGIYGSSIISNLLGKSYPLWKKFGWNVLLNFFYMPGCLAGSLVSDIKWLNPKRVLIIGLVCQAVIGYIMAGCYAELDKVKYVGAFVVVYGVFLAFGEFGPGNNIGLLASKTSATCIRGQYYGIAAAIGKIGAFSGGYGLTAMQNRYHINDPNVSHSDLIKAGQLPFWVASSMALFAAVIALFLLPDIGQDTIDREDEKFREFLVSHGYDITKMGLHSESTEAITHEVSEK